MRSRWSVANSRGAGQTTARVWRFVALSDAPARRRLPGVGTLPRCGNASPLLDALLRRIPPLSRYRRAGTTGMFEIQRDVERRKLSCLPNSLSTIPYSPIHSYDPIPGDWEAERGGAVGAHNRRAATPAYRTPPDAGRFLDGGGPAGWSSRRKPHAPVATVIRISAKTIRPRLDFNNKDVRATDRVSGITASQGEWHRCGNANGFMTQMRDAEIVVTSQARQCHPWPRRGAVVRSVAADRTVIGQKAPI